MRDLSELVPIVTRPDHHRRHVFFMRESQMLLLYLHCASDDYVVGVRSITLIENLRICSVYLDVLGYLKKSILDRLRVLHEESEVLAQC